eukprot:TRINITY_DN693_c0_g1_i1.p1 TRINITY_DN693_c0_g1~~TRINITY_DN693_c0_g1_i1.p1  ORF type:complete len:618 (+),score=121.19 TRINITY_DN693_c0_g1_i1:157-2010(+)
MSYLVSVFYGESEEDNKKRNADFFYRDLVRRKQKELEVSYSTQLWLLGCLTQAAVGSFLWRMYRAEPQFESWSVFFEMAAGTLETVALDLIPYLSFHEIRYLANTYCPQPPSGSFQLYYIPLGPIHGELITYIHPVTSEPEQKLEMLEDIDEAIECLNTSQDILDNWRTVLKAAEPPPLSNETEDTKVSDGDILTNWKTLTEPMLPPIMVEEPDIFSDWKTVTEAPRPTKTQEEREKKEKGLEYEEDDDESTLPTEELVVVYIHGGGYCVNSAYALRMQVREFSRVTGRPWLSLEYSLAPDYPFPTALNECFQAYLKITEKFKSVVLCGDSAGGGLVVSLCLKLKQANVPLPAGLILISPWVDLSEHSLARDVNKNFAEVLLTEKNAEYQQKKAASLGRADRNLLEMFVQAYVYGNDLSTQNKLPILQSDGKGEPDIIADKNSEEEESDDGKEKDTVADKNSEEEESEDEDWELLGESGENDFGVAEEEQEEGYDTTHPFISPTFGDLSGLPPAIIIAGAEEWLIGDIKEFFSKYRRAQKESSLIMMADMMHCFPLLCQGLHPAAEEATSLMREFIDGIDKSERHKLRQTQWQIYDITATGSVSTEKVARAVVSGPD